MHAVPRALIAGAAGAAVTNLLHETVRRVSPNAPRVDLLGMQAMARMYRAVGGEPPRGQTLYIRTLIGDVISNAAYFGVAAAVPKRTAAAGIALGLAAGVGAVALPRPLALEPSTTARSLPTALLTVVIYAAGGAAAGLVAERTSA